jgi:hypothetical protein
MITMSIRNPRLKDTLLMAFAIQLTIIGTAPTDDSLVPLFFVGVLITIIVLFKEVARRFAEYSNR